MNATHSEILDLSGVPKEVFALCEELHRAGKRGWIVGGCVRDLLLGRTVNDWDIATDALPDEVRRIFPRTFPTGIEHGTVTVMMHRTPFEVTTLRGEGAYSDGRRPDAVHFVDDITADLARRDFTVNAIAVYPLDGTVIDPFSGQADMRAKTLRAVGNAIDRFGEDGLRVLRAARFVATLGFSLDPVTEAAIAPTLGTYRKVSQERVRDEWLKTMKADKPSAAFEIMQRTGILAVTCPELMEGVGLDQNRYHAYDVWRHGLECMDACPGDPIRRMAALMHDIGKPRTRALSDKTGDFTFYDHERVGAEMVEPICTRLRFSNDERTRIAHLVRHHLFHYTAEWTDAAVRRWLKRIGKDQTEDFFVLNEADVRAKGKDPTDDLASLAGLKLHVAKVLEAGAALTVRDLAISGRDLIAEFAMKPGPIVGDLLNRLLEDVIDDPALNVREILLGRVRAEWSNKT